MKKLVTLILVIVMVFSMGIISFAAEDDFQGNPITLKLSHNNASTTPLYYGLQDWCDAVYEATHGTVTIEQYPSESLGATTTGIEMLQTGIADLLWATTGMFSGQFNYLDSFALPVLGVQNSVIGTNQIWDIVEDENFGKYIDQEYAQRGMKVLLAFQSEGGIVGSYNKIEKPEDFKGLVVRSIAGGIADYMSVLGASPQFMGPGDIYLNLEKHVIDAFVFEWAGVESFKLAEEIPYFLDFNIYRVPGFTVISDLAWNKLSEDQQNAILGVSLREGSLKLAEMYDEAETAYKEKCYGLGMQSVVPDAETQAIYAELAVPVWEARKAELEDGEAYFKAIQDVIAKYNE